MGERAEERTSCPPRRELPSTRVGLELVRARLGAAAAADQTGPIRYGMHTNERKKERNREFFLLLYDTRAMRTLLVHTCRETTCLHIMSCLCLPGTISF